MNWSHGAPTTTPKPAGRCWRSFLDKSSSLDTENTAGWENHVYNIFVAHHLTGAWLVALETIRLLKVCFSFLPSGCCVIYPQNCPNPHFPRNLFYVQWQKVSSVQSSAVFSNLFFFSTFWTITSFISLVVGPLLVFFATVAHFDLYWNPKQCILSSETSTKICNSQWRINKMVAGNITEFSPTCCATTTSPSSNSNSNRKILVQFLGILLSQIKAWLYQRP